MPGVDFGAQLHQGTPGCNGPSSGPACANLGQKDSNRDELLWRGSPSCGRDDGRKVGQCYHCSSTCHVACLASKKKCKGKRFLSLSSLTFLIAACNISAMQSVQALFHLPTLRTVKQEEATHTLRIIFFFFGLSFYKGLLSLSLRFDLPSLRPFEITYEYNGQGLKSHSRLSLQFAAKNAAMNCRCLMFTHPLHAILFQAFLPATAANL